MRTRQRAIPGRSSGWSIAVTAGSGAPSASTSWERSSAWPARRNKKLGVTGALLINDDQFVQTLEGPEPAVRDLYAKISKDRRHEHVELLESGDVAGRVSGRWAMAKMAAEGEPDIPLLTNVDKGGISPAQPRPAAPGAGSRPRPHAPVAAPRRSHRLRLKSHPPK